MSDTLIIALEASFENDPIRMERKLWGAIEDQEDEKKIEPLTNQKINDTIKKTKGYWCI